MAIFLIQMVKFILKRSNLNLIGSIRSYHVVTAHQPQQQPLVQTVSPGR
jgi:hypothetical protein